MSENCTEAFDKSDARKMIFEEKELVHAFPTGLIASVLESNNHPAVGRLFFITMNCFMNLALLATEPRDEVRLLFFGGRTSYPS